MNEIVNAINGVIWSPSAHLSVSGGRPLLLPAQPFPNCVT